MVIIQNEIYQNLAATVAPFGNGQAGLLWVMMPEALYIYHFNEHVEPSNDPCEYQTIFQQMHWPNAGVSS